MPSLMQSARNVLDRAFEPDAVFTAREIALIEPIARAVATPQPAGERYIRQSLGGLSVALPSQATDTVAGTLKLNTYMVMLAGCDERALAYACRRCLDELDWMPTIHQIKDRMAKWVSPEEAAIRRARAIIRAGRRAPEEGDVAAIPPEEVDRVNAFLRTRGIAMQFSPDGTTFQAQAA